MNENKLYPEFVEINISENCNRTCSFCPRGNGYPNVDDYMSLDIAKLIAEQCEGFTDNVHIVGRGEPFMHPDFVDIVRVFSERFSVKIVTNGDFLHKYVDEMDELLDLGSGRHRITVSVYDNQRKYESLVARYADYSDIRFFKCFDNGNNLHDDVFYETHHMGNRGGYLDINRNHLSLPCKMPLNRVFVDLDGTVNSCCHDWEHKTVYGSVTEQSLGTIWRDNMADLRKKLLDGERSCAPQCTNCDITDDPLKHVYPDYITNQEMRIKIVNES